VGDAGVGVRLVQLEALAQLTRHGVKISGRNDGLAKPGEGKRVKLRHGAIIAQ
jgi:hypothetical protein